MVKLISQLCDELQLGVCVCVCVYVSRKDEAIKHHLSTSKHLTSLRKKPQQTKPGQLLALIPAGVS